MGLGLIPVGHGRVIVGTRVGVAVLDGGFEGLGERDRGIEMEAVDGGTAACFFFPDHGGAEERVGKRVAAEIVGAEEIVFRAGAGDGGLGYSIDKEHIVAFSPPIILILQDGHGNADVVAAASGLQPDEIVFTA